jgi:hypothetical protein
MAKDRQNIDYQSRVGKAPIEVTDVRMNDLLEKISSAIQDRVVKNYPSRAVLSSRDNVAQRSIAPLRLV